MVFLGCLTKKHASPRALPLCKPKDQNRYQLSLYVFYCIKSTSFCLIWDAILMRILHEYASKCPKIPESVPTQFIRVFLHKKHTISSHLRCDFDAYSVRMRIKMPQKYQKSYHHLKTCSHARTNTRNPRSRQGFHAESADSVYLL